MNKDRGIIKWKPFENLISSNFIIESILAEKRKIKKPILSKEQERIIEEKLIEAYYEQIPVTLKIYQKGYIYSINTKIINIDQIYKKITIKNKCILFNQILEVIF